MKKRALLSVLFVFIFTTITGTCRSTILQIDTPLKALVLYFPSPSVMRCLNHSGIPRSFRKAFVYRKAKSPNKEEVAQSLTIGVNMQKKKKLLFTGNISTKSKFVPMEIKGELSFGLENQKFNLGLFGLENLLGLQGKTHIKDKIGNQIVNYETFLKSTKGKIGDQKYNLELNGEDRVGGIGSDRSLQYLLTGTGMLGSYDISVNGKDTKKDNYEIIEKYGPVEIFTIVKVYD